MALIRRAFDILLPPGKAWIPFGNLSLVYDALVLSLDRVKTFLSDAMIEAIPKTSEETIQQWHETLGLNYVVTQSLEEKQQKVDLSYTSTGGSSLSYLEGQIQREFEGVYIVEVDAFNYDLLGEVTTIFDYYRALDIIDRIFPLHLVPFVDLDILETMDVSVCGIEITGLGITGKALEA